MVDKYKNLMTLFGSDEERAITFFWLQIYFHDIPDQVIDKLIEEGIVLYAAGGLIIEHPLILPCIKEVVSVTATFLSTIIQHKS
ncbi:hypothetical protein A4A49_14613 [Nicotiana attenuata]|uniref:Uncharacterized protein n=1 Tax=Nicotiana attenuata TaxID=49451 RepID=A0A314LA14_NICAT|nr:hypothetical protein A4A49_14613 [Nicotiana attenuata]